MNMLSLYIVKALFKGSRNGVNFETPAFVDFTFMVAAANFRQATFLAHQRCRALYVYPAVETHARVDGKLLRDASFEVRSVAFKTEVVTAS